MKALAAAQGKRCGHRWSLAVGGHRWSLVAIQWLSFSYRIMGYAR